MEFQISQNKQNHQSISKKKYLAGQICPERAEAKQIRPRSRAAAVPFEPAGRARLSTAPGYRIGTRYPWPSD
jgi:hypothetical protein